jgi:hypothetical protein
LSVNGRYFDELGDIVTAEETIAHFQDMGVLRQVTRTGLTDIRTIAHGKPIVQHIFATAPEGYAHRCMKDFVGTRDFSEDFFGINAVTTDDVPVRMSFVD